MEVDHKLDKSETFTKALTLIKHELENLKEGCIPVVLLSTGAYNPVHKMHVNVFKLAKDELEAKHNMITICGIMSPSHDKYLRQKMGSEFDQNQSSENRLAMCRLAIKDAGYDWLLADEYESSLPRFADFPLIVEHFDKCLRSSDIITSRSSQKNQATCKYKAVRVMYICGADHAAKVDMTQIRHFGCVAIERPGYGKLDLQPSFIIPIKIDDNSENVSSSDLKRRIKNEKSLDDIVFPSVIEFIQKHSLYGYHQK